jgi:hypothetical protein
MGCAIKRPFFDNAAIGQVAVADLACGLIADFQLSPLLRAINRRRIGEADALRGWVFAGRSAGGESGERERGCKGSEHRGPLIAAYSNRDKLNCAIWFRVK